MLVCLYQQMIPPLFVRALPYFTFLNGKIITTPTIIVQRLSSYRVSASGASTTAAATA